MLIAINGFFAVYSKLLLWRARIVLRYDIIIFFSVCNIQRAKRTHFIIFSFLHHFKWYSGRVIKLIITCILYLNILVHLHLCFLLLSCFNAIYAQTLSKENKRWVSFSYHLRYLFSYNKKILAKFSILNFAGWNKKVRSFSFYEKILKTTDKLHDKLDRKML